MNRLQKCLIEKNAKQIIKPKKVNTKKKNLKACEKLHLITKNKK